MRPQKDIPRAPEGLEEILCGPAFGQIVNAAGTTYSKLARDLSTRNDVFQGYICTYIAKGWVRFTEDIIDEVCAHLYSSATKDGARLMAFEGLIHDVLARRRTRV